MGRHPGRRRADLPQHERVGAARRSRADAVFRAQSGAAADARAATRRSPTTNADAQRRVAGAPESRHQPRVSGRHRSRRTARWRSSPRSARRSIYRGDRLPAELYGNVFVAEPAANLVSRIVLERRRRRRCARARRTSSGEFLASTDERFRPVYLSNAPDGTLYIVDMYRGIIQHRASTSPSICATTSSSASSNSRTGSGASIASCTRRPRRDTAPAAAQSTPARAGGAAVASERLVARHGAAAARRARRQVGRAARSSQLAGRATDWRTRLHALWTLDGLDAIEPATGDHGARRSVPRRARVGDPHRGAMAGRAEPARSRRRC